MNVVLDGFSSVSIGLTSAKIASDKRHVETMQLIYCN